MSNSRVDQELTLPITFDVSEDSYYDADGDAVFYMGKFAFDGCLIASAINQYDKLIEQNKMLREALSLVVDKTPMNQNIYVGGYMLLLSHDDCQILRETLNIIELN